MKINVNNKSIATDATDLGTLVSELSLPQKGVAVAVDNRIVPRELWPQTPLKEGASVIVIKAAQGG